MNYYKNMYDRLFNAISDVILLLQHARQHTEDIYIEQADFESVQEHCVEEKDP